MPPEQPLNISLYHHQSHQHLVEPYKVGYYMWASILVLSVIPLIVLVFFNASNAFHIHKSAQHDAEFGPSTRQSNKDPKATKTLFVIVAVFFVCHRHSPRILYSLLFYLDYSGQLLLLTITLIYQIPP